jgi:hypothetical protein
MSRVAGILPDAERAFAAECDVQMAYQQGGFGTGLAPFIVLTSWQREFTEAFASQPAPRSRTVRPEVITSFNPWSHGASPSQLAARTL